MAFGYHQKYLDVDLTSGSFAWKPLPNEVLRKCLGGSGLGTWLLLQSNAAEVDPLGESSQVVFAFSPLVGSPLTTSAKFAVVSKSPLTQRINDSLASSGFAIRGKMTGSDAIVIRGRASQPSILVIDGSNVSLQDGSKYWGMTCSQVESALHADLGSDFDLAVIGPAGENQIRYATISHDGRHAGRGGSGAIFGSKFLKAIAVRGSERTTFADPSGLSEFAKQLSRDSFGPATAKYRELGTMANLLVFNRLSALPTRNFQEGRFAEVEALAPEVLSESKGKANASCVACTIGCEHIYSLNADKPTKSTGVRLEYENVFSLGSLCGVADPDIVLKASKFCDEMGLDTISAGGTIAFAMECAEQGWVDESWLRFGDGQALLRALEAIAHRRDIGNRLAEGSARMAAELGPEAVAIAPVVKGLELPGYEPRALQTMALGLAVGTRGADHNRSGAYEVDFSDQADRRNLNPDVVPLAVDTENRAALMDSLILCKFLRGVFSDFYAASAKMLQLTAGWDVTADEMEQTAREIISAKKEFNIQAGWQPAEDTLPDRFFREALPSDPSAALSRQTLDACIQEYNQQRGWTPEGWLKQ